MNIADLSLIAIGVTAIAITFLSILTIVTKNMSGEYVSKDMSGFVVTIITSGVVLWMVFFLLMYYK